MILILNEYSLSRANRLSKLVIPNVNDPFEIEILWLQHEDFNKTSTIFNNKLHKHTFYELHFVLDGENIIADKNGKTFSIKSGEAMILAPGSLHLSKYYTGNLKRFSIAFSLLENSTINKAFSALDYYIYKLSKMTINNLNCIFSECDRDNALSSYIIRNRIFELINELLILGKYEEYMPQTTISSQDLLVNKIKKYIDDNSNIFLSCKDIADYCKYNEIYLNRIFKNRTGNTLLKYIHKKKIQHSKEMLKNKKISVTTISYTLGFSNEYYFNAFFKREVGVSPGVYRKYI